MFILAACGGGEDTPPTQIPTDTPTNTLTYTPMQTTIFVPTVTASMTPTITEFPTFNPQSQSSLSRPTLPPSWTPTATVTASMTPTITLTPTATPTLTVDQLCADGAAFSFNWEQEEYTLDDSVPLFVFVDDPNATIEFEAIHQADESIWVEFSLPGGGEYFGTLPLNGFPEAGVYDWTMSLTRGEETGLCEISGTLVIKKVSLLDLLRSANPTITPETDE